MATLEMYTTKRGITPETLARFGLEQVGDEVMIPYGKHRKYRRGWEPHERRFRWDTSTGPGSLFNLQEAGRPTVILTEGESDAMRLWQEVPNHDLVGVVAVPGVDGFSSAIGSQITGNVVLCVLDRDSDYAVRGQVDRAYGRIRESLGARAKRVTLPSDVKDICEFFQTHHYKEFERLLEQAQESKYKGLDLSAPPPETKWLVQGLVAQGDTHLLFGEPTVGKSWLTMDLAVAVAEGRGSWLGARMSQGAGRVLYVDEENPQDVVLQRLKKLGLLKGRGNVRYLLHPGIRLDSNPADLLEEAVGFGPQLIVLDSMTRLHTRDENQAGEISRLFNDGIIPLAHKTGAAVVLIHHTNKTESNSSFRRARGSGDMIGAPDTALDIRAGDQNQGTIYIAKSRRVQTGMWGNFVRNIGEDSATIEPIASPF